jgi:hypothetical protein
MTRKYTVTAHFKGKLIKEEKGILDHGTSIMLGNAWRINGIIVNVGNCNAKIEPDYIFVFEVNKQNEHEMIAVWNKETGGYL